MPYLKKSLFQAHELAGLAVKYGISRKSGRRKRKGFCL